VIKDKLYQKERKFSMKKYYAAYGSNLNVAQMKMRCPGAKIVGTSEIKDYQLLFKGSKTGSYLTIEKCDGSSVPIAVWEVSQGDELMLDTYEGYPVFYYKKEMKLPVKIRKNHKIAELDVFVYIMHEERKTGIPSSAYVKTCIEGYQYFRFSLMPIRNAFVISDGGERA
jgi:gamma-glutamylcyclotransferase (GGCT)/AIG2-like uncharacterized protein YtfP